MLNNFIYAQTKDLFVEALEAGNILDDAIVFIEDTKEIWNHGHYFAGDCGYDVNSFTDLQTYVSTLAPKDWVEDKLENHIMVGATSTTAGKSGCVPAPSSSDNYKFLQGDGTWSIPVTSGSGDINDIFASWTKLYLIGAMNQNSSGAETFSDSNVFIDTGSKLNSLLGAQIGNPNLADNTISLNVDGLTQINGKVNITKTVSSNGVHSDYIHLGKNSDVNDNPGCIIFGDIANDVNFDNNQNNHDNLTDGTYTWIAEHNPYAGDDGESHDDHITINALNEVHIGHYDEDSWSGIRVNGGRIYGRVSGDVTGNLTGNVTGNVTGNCSGSSGSCTGNAASATKLATTRTIWGNDFNGTGNVGGSLNLGNGIAITSTKFNDTKTINLLHMNSSNLLLIGQGLIGEGDTYLYGQNIVFKTGTTGTGTERFNMDSNGNTRIHAATAVTKRLRVEAENQIGNTVPRANYGFIDVHTSTSSSHSTGNVGIMTIGTNYGGSTTITNYDEGTDISGSGGTNHTAMTVYRKQVGLGRLFTDEEMRTIYEKNKTLGVGGLSVAGNITSEAAITANAGVFSSSDERLKNFEESIPVDFEKLKALKKNYFTWKDENKAGRQIGVSAQEIQSIYPELVGDDLNNNLTVSYDKLSVVALAAIDKLYDENVELKNTIKSLEDRLSKLETFLDNKLNN